MDRPDIEKQLTELRSKVAELETELATEGAKHPWEAKGFYPAFSATTGFMLGIFGATTSLLANVIGSVFWKEMKHVDQNPLRLIQVYLTFPLGESALTMENGLALAIGCVLYLGTGMFYGVLFQMLMAKYVPRASLIPRLLFCSVLGIALWLINFYGILSWLQPLLFGGKWILELVPWWVAAITHLIYGWTMAVVYPLGEYQPYKIKASTT